MVERSCSRRLWLSIAVTVCLSGPLANAGRPQTSFTNHAAIPERGPADVRASILVYHRFGPLVADSMTVRTATFRWQLQYLREHGYQVIPLRALVVWRSGLGPPPPPRSIVITADDGHQSVFTEMMPLVREFAVPVTLFIYPSAISNAAYAMTWDQLGTVRETGLFDIQSHTYWHPNFAAERRRLPPAGYRTFALRQLTRSRAVIAQRLGVGVDVIAWPFGVYDEDLLQMAADAGYVAGVTLDRRAVTAGDRIIALPRFLITDAASGRNFAALLPSELP